MATIVVCDVCGGRLGRAGALVKLSVEVGFYPPDGKMLRSVIDCCAMCMRKASPMEVSVSLKELKKMVNA